MVNNNNNNNAPIQHNCATVKNIYIVYLSTSVSIKLDICSIWWWKRCSSLRFL